MTNEEIKEFKHFLYVQGGMTYSIFMRHITNKPWKQGGKGKSPEEYLFALHDPIHAVRYAFPWDKTAEGFTYWNKVSKAWINHYLQLYFSTRFQHAIPYSRTNLLQIIRVYYFTTQIFTAEPDLSDYMRKDTIAQMIRDNDELRVVYKPMTLDSAPAPTHTPAPAPALISFDVDDEEETADTPAPQPSSVSGASLSGVEGVALRATQSDSVQSDAFCAAQSDNDDFTFFDFGQKRHKGGHSHFTNIERIISVYCNKKGSCRFGRILSEEIVAHDLHYLRIRKDNLTGELCFVFTRDQGCPLYYSEKKDRKDITVCANNLELVKFLQQFFSLSEGTNYLRASKNKANSSDFITYVITKYEP